MSLTLQQILDKVIARAQIPVKSKRNRANVPDLKPVPDDWPAGGWMPDPTNVCAYRPDDYPATPACFGGIFIPDELYSPKLEGKTVSSKRVLKVLVKAGVLTEEEAVEGDKGYHPKLILLSACQYAHDYNPPEGWREALGTLANTNGLDFNWPVAEEVAP